jgi:hypothetical protein
LQRYILKEAGKRNRVYYADVLMGFYGWRPKGPIRRHGEGGYPVEESEAGGAGCLFFPGTHKFSRREIGEATYRKTLAALSRSCSRLGVRGLVKCVSAANSHWAAVEITDAGREWLSVNSAAICTQS